MNCRIASLLLATTLATATATTSSKAYRIFSEPPRPKAGKAFHSSSSSDSDESFITPKSKSSKLHSPSSSLSMPSAKTFKSKTFKSKAVKCIKAIDDDQSVSLSMPTLSKTGKRTKCIPTMSISMSIDVETAMPTYYPTYSPSATPTSTPTHAPTAQPTNAPSAKPTSAPTHAPTAQPTNAPTAKPTSAPTAQPTNAPSAKPTSAPTHAPTHAPTAQPTNAPSAKPTSAPTLAPTAQPTTRRPTQRMFCQSGDFVDALGRDCFWYEDPNVELGCESLRDESSTDVDLTNEDGKTPWDECCFCGGGTMVPEDALQRRNLRVLAEPKDLGAAEPKMEAI